MTRLHVEIEDFTDAALVMRTRIADPARIALGSVGTALDHCGAMAGDDEGGRAWAAAYDPAADSVLQATAQLIVAADRTADMFSRSALNYAAAEDASTTGGSPASSATELDRLPPTDHPAPRPSPPPTAAGGGGGEPTGWGVIRHLVGYVWPNGHQDRLRDAAAAYRECALAVEALQATPALASMRFAVDRLPEADDIVAVCQGMHDRLQRLAEAHRTLAGACEALATHLDQCHSEVAAELRELLMESVAIQAAGAFFSAFTLGAAEGPAQTAQAARLSAVAARVAQLIRRFTAAAKALDATIATATETAASIVRSLEALGQARLVTATVGKVPRTIRVTHMATEGREAAAAGRLARAGSAAVKMPSRLAGRKMGDPGVWGNPARLSNHFKRHGAAVGAGSEQEYVRKASDMLQRAMRGELPRKIARNGDIRVYDPKTGSFASYRPDGATRTFFVPTSSTYFERQPGVLR
ncbi:hypothetical protein SAMN05443575_3762 [Jatrophihabitans endophyticus]|uniref:Uncharacterized protein n=1 Tax=Jatrophihabitans endophyticus TaxID=1206085 RepID=A0A1M5S7G4_9ACTN|nr:hypothetical protein [Jatrophihabitans endophyticus]SHH34537.1 hypothetical protein SAMN05443575_3762 [Jatrophihabitans endophyticus]